MERNEEYLRYTQSRKKTRIASHKERAERRRILSEKKNRVSDRATVYAKNGKEPTLEFAAEHWLDAVKGTVKESTFTRYYRCVYSYLLPYFGMCRSLDIDSFTVNRFKENMLKSGGKRGKGLSEKTVTDILSVLKLLLTYTCAEGYTTMNTSLIKNPKRKRKEVSVIPNEKLIKLEEYLLGSDAGISAGILLTLHTGIRNGELCGLRWSDFCFKRRTVQIRRTVERIADLDPLSDSKTKVIVAEPKTDSSMREIPLPRSLCDYLKKHRSSPNTYVLTGTEKPSEPHTLYIRYRRLLNRLSLGEYSFHALRHTFATRGMESGFDPKSLSEILGHADVTTTLRCYVHPSAEQKRRQMETLFNLKQRNRKYEK